MPSLFRVAFGFFFCAESWVRCEGGIALQPGVIVGDSLGVQFDLHGALDMRFLLEFSLQPYIPQAIIRTKKSRLLFITQKVLKHFGYIGQINYLRYIIFYQDFSLNYQ